MRLGSQGMMVLPNHVYIWLSFLNDRALIGICRWIVFTDSGFWKYSWAHLVMSNDRIMSMSDAVSSESPKTTGIQLRSSSLSLTRRDFSSFSESFEKMLCTVDDEICKAFAIWHWGTLFLKYSTIFLCTLSQVGEPLLIFISDRLCLPNTCLL